MGRLAKLPPLPILPYEHICEERPTDRCQMQFRLQLANKTDELYMSRDKLDIIRNRVIPLKRRMRE